MLLTRASDPPFVDHSTIPRVDITEMNTRARCSTSICTKHSPQQHFPIGYLRCYNFFVVTQLSPSNFKVTLCAFCLLNLHSCNLHNCNLHSCCLRSCCGLHNCILHICNLNVLPSASLTISNHQCKQLQSYIFTHTHIHIHTASSFLFI